jgi:hypothetical protein
MRKIVGLILVVVVSACSSPAGGAPGGGGGNAQLPSDACSLLTLDEVNTATGKTFQAGVKGGASGTAECAWTIQGNAATVNLEVRQFDASAYSVLAGGSANTKVPGIGDQALLIPLISTIDVAKGSLEFLISPIAIGGADWQVVATALAKLVVGRI